jgi:hypothetical protein
MINLATALYIDPQLKNVHSKPGVWPQFNGSARTEWIRKDWLPRAEAALERDDLDPEVRKELAAAAKAGKALIEGSKADAEKTKAAGKRLTDALHAAGVTDFNDRQPVEPTWQEKAGEKLARFADEGAFRIGAVASVLRECFVEFLPISTGVRKAADRDYVGWQIMVALVAIRLEVSFKPFQEFPGMLLVPCFLILKDDNVVFGVLAGAVQPFI